MISKNVVQLRNQIGNYLRKKTTILELDPERINEITEDLVKHYVEQRRDLTSKEFRILCNKYRKVKWID